MPTMQGANGNGSRVELVEPLCGQAECTETARHRMFWPGRAPEPICDAHAHYAIELAECAGFDLVIEPLPPYGVRLAQAEHNEILWATLEGRPVKL